MLILNKVKVLKRRMSKIVQIFTIMCVCLCSHTYLYCSQMSVRVFLCFHIVMSGKAVNLCFSHTS